MPDTFTFVIFLQLEGTCFLSRSGLKSDGLSVTTQHGPLPLSPALTRPGLQVVHAIMHWLTSDLQAGPALLLAGGPGLELAGDTHAR